MGGITSIYMYDYSASLSFLSLLHYTVLGPWQVCTTLKSQLFSRVKVQCLFKKLLVPVTSNDLS